jgi:acyl carrier protein
VADHDQPASDIERDIAAIWSELLHVTPIGRNDDFFALGGHSLMAMEILTKIRSRLGVELPLTALFSDTGFTVTELAKRVEVVLLEQASDEDIAGILADMPSEPHI